MCIKDISIVNTDLSKIVIVDNRISCFTKQPSNGIWIKSYYGQDDNELERVKLFLLSIKDHLDVREKIQKEFYMEQLLKFNIQDQL